MTRLNTNVIQEKIDNSSIDIVLLEGYIQEAKDREKTDNVDYEKSIDNIVAQSEMKLKSLEVSRAKLTLLLEEELKKGE